MFKIFRQNEIYENALKNIENINSNYLFTAYMGLSIYNANYTKRLGKAVTKRLSEMSSIQLIRLSETFRSSYYNENHDWKNFNFEKCKNFFDCEEDYINVLALGTFHPVGYFRLECMKKLSEYNGNTHYFILRLNDWVEVIRNSAEEILKNKIKKCSVTEILYLTTYAEKVFHSGRRDNQFIKSIYSQFKEILDNNNIDVYSIKSYDLYTRKIIYKFLSSDKIISSEEFETIINSEKDSFCQSYLISHFLKLYQPDIKDVDKLLNHKSFYVRYEAMQYKYRTINNIWSGFENSLLDKRRIIREYAVFLLNKHTDFNIRQFYINNINLPNAITGLGETGSKEDDKILLPYLDSESPKIVSSTIYALNNLTDSKYSETYWNFLFNKNNSISKSAYQSIIKSKIRYGCKKVYNEMIKTNDKLLKRRLLNILCKNEDSWERVPYLIKILEKDSERIVIEAVQKRNRYKKISAELENSIRFEITEKRKNSLQTKLKTGNDIVERILWGIELDFKFLCR